MVQLLFLFFSILYASSKNSFTQRALRQKIFVLIFDNTISHVVGLRESKTLKEDFEEYLASKWCCWASGGVFKSAVTPDSQWFLQKAHLPWFLTFLLEAKFILCNFQLMVGQVLTSCHWKGWRSRVKQNYFGFVARNACGDFSCT